MECYIFQRDDTGRADRHHRAGSHTDRRWVRLVSRRKYNELLREGIRIYEHRAGMTHAKVLNVDDLWLILGTPCPSEAFEAWHFLCKGLLPFVLSEPNIPTRAPR